MTANTIPKMGKELSAKCPRVDLPLPDSIKHLIDSLQIIAELMQIIAMTKQIVIQ